MLRPAPGRAGGRLVLAALALLASALPASAQRGFGDAPAPLPHAELAAKFLEARGYSSDDDPATVDVEALFEAEYTRLDVGLFDLRFPVEDLAELESAGHLRDVVVALLRTQEIFHEWVEPELGRQRDLAADLKTIRRWIDDWDLDDLHAAAERSPSDLFAGLEPDEEVTEALHRFADWMRSGAPVGTKRPDYDASRIFLLPTRPRFNELVCFAGWYFRDDWKKFWKPDVAAWLGCRFGDSQLMALQFASPEVSEGDFELGLPLNYRSDTVLQQQAVHYATQALFDNYFGDGIDPFASTALALNMVREQFGVVETRIEGDLRARFTEAFTAFVPGGNPAGGTLPGLDPDGRWRQKKAEGRFLELLQINQREGEEYTRHADEKHLFFEIEHDDGRQRTGVRAPFLGSAADGKELPADGFVGDYQEFYRAYKSAFWHWLRTEGRGSKHRSRDTFAELFLRLPNVGASGFEALLQELYGAPLSEPEPGRDSLEGQFLIWISRL